jgi:solute carrier family 27 (fatty acid transporter), member 1/4
MNILKSIVNFFRVLFYAILMMPRDVRTIFLLLKILKKASAYDKKKTSVSQIFTKWVKEQPNKACFIFNDQIWTFRDVI